MAVSIGWKRRMLFATVAATLLIAAMTLPSLAAPTKTMKFQVNSTGPTTLDFNGPTPPPVNTASANSSVSFWIRATNTTPGSGNPNSLRVTAPTSPSPGFVITGGAVNNANSSNTGNNVTPVPGGSGAYIDFNGIKPVQNNQYITVRIDATTSSCPGGVQSNDWAGVFWTGSTFGSGQSFSTNASSLTKTTLTSTACPSLVFVTAPHDAATDTKITGTDFDPDGTTVQVAYQVNGNTSNAADGSTVTITEDGPGSFIPNTNTATLSGGLASFAGLQIDTAGDYNLTASLTGGPSTAPVAITITPAGVCPNSGVSGQEDFTTPEFNVPGQGTLNISELTSNQCLGLDVNFTNPESGVQQWNVLLEKPDNEDKLTGYATWTWDLPGNDPVPWTQVKWTALIGGTLQETDFVDLPRCNADAVTPLPDPTLPNQDYVDLFPTVSTSLGPLTAGVCMYDSALHVSGNTYNEVQKIAIFEDPSGRK